MDEILVVLWYIYVSMVYITSMFNFQNGCRSRTILQQRNTFMKRGIENYTQAPWSRKAALTWGAVTINAIKQCFFENIRDGNSAFRCPSLIQHLIEWNISIEISKGWQYVTTVSNCQSSKWIALTSEVLSHGACVWKRAQTDLWDSWNRTKAFLPKPKAKCNSHLKIKALQSRTQIIT